MIITTRRARSQWRLRRKRRVMARKGGTTRERGVRAPRPLKSSKQWQLTLSPHRFQPHHMLQPQLLQMLQDPTPVIFLVAISAASTITANAGNSIAPVATEGDTLQGSAGLILLRTRVRETTRTTTTTAITTTPMPAATIQGLATPVSGAEGRDTSVEIALTTTTQETEEQEEC